MSIGVLVQKDNGIMYAMWYDREFTFPEHPAVEQFLNGLDESFDSLSKLMIVEDYLIKHPEKANDIFAIDYPDVSLWADGSLRGYKTLPDAVGMIKREYVFNKEELASLFSEYDQCVKKKKEDQSELEEISYDILSRAILRRDSFLYGFELYDGDVWLLANAFLG